MCRIVGIASFEPCQDLESIVISMRDSMAHGGPDDAGIYVDKENGIVLGHRRLSIIDLTSLGHQPMSSEDGNIWIAYNGEVYNFQEMRQELKNSGDTFKSNSDTEVILRAYQKWGEGAFERLNGMFAFCIYDKRKNLLYLVRDHAGIKPLYYSISNKHLVFSSEVKAFKVFDRGWKENKDWRIYFLIFGHIPEPYTTLENILMLPKQSFLKLNLKNGKQEVKKYTDIPFTEDITDVNEAVELVKSTFNKAVERHLISDAPIGVFLSGGIDSSLIALIAHKFQKEKLRTLSIVFNEKDFSEEKYQNIILKKINPQHHSYLVTEDDFINNLKYIFRAMDQPTTDGINSYFISKCAKEDGLKTVLSGLGGDELFGGYPSFERINKLWPFLNMNKNVKGVFKYFEHLKNDKFKKLSFLSIPDPLAIYLAFRGLFTISTVSQILGVEQKEIRKKLEQIYLNNCMPDCGKKNFASYLETNLYMQNQLLKDTDIMSMWHSIELRVPFLDKEHVKTVFSIDEKIKFSNNLSKSLLIKAFEDILPGEIVSRKKQGFTFPFDIWVKGRGKEMFFEAVSNKNIDKNYAESFWHKFENGKLHWARIWGIILLGGIKF